MIQCQLKLQLRPTQERMLNRWLWNLTGVYNWALRRIELGARDGFYYSAYDVKSWLNGHGSRVNGITLGLLRATATQAHGAWRRCFRGQNRKPRLKSRRNKLNSIHFAQATSVRIEGRRVVLEGVGRVKFHAQDIPAGQISSARLVLRSSGWYLSLFVRAEAQPVPHLADGQVGIDPGFSSLLTLSSGEKFDHPRELQRTEQRLAQAQRGNRNRLAARLLERQGNQRRDRNHKLSRRLVAENALIAWSKDSHRAFAKRFGKSVASAAHGQLRTMIAYKCRAGGRRFIEVSNRYSTVTCSACGARSGPTGYAGLSVRTWVCVGCGAELDRDCNAAENTLRAGLGMSHERSRETAPGIAI